LQLEGAAAVATSNDVDRERIIATFAVDKCRVIFQPHGFDPNLISPRKKPSEKNLLFQEGLDFVVGDMTGFQDYEDIRTLIQGAAIAAREVPGLRLSLAGNVPRSLNLQEIARQAGLTSERIVTPGPISRSNVG
ncbi:unnamed protein product, partial [marine sediment metagenome]